MKKKLVSEDIIILVFLLSFPVTRKEKKIIIKKESQFALVQKGEIKIIIFL